MKPLLLVRLLFLGSFLTMQGMNVRSTNNNFFAPLYMPKLQRILFQDNKKAIGMELLYFKRQCNPKKVPSIFTRISTMKKMLFDLFSFSSK